MEKNVSANDFLQRAENEAPCFKLFLEALFQVDSRHFYQSIDKKSQERPFVNHLHHQLESLIERNPDYAGAIANVEPTKCKSIFGKILRKNGISNVNYDIFPTCYPDLVLHRGMDNIDGQYILCEAKVYKTPNFYNFVKDFGKIQKLTECQLGFKYYIFLLINGTIDELKAQIQRKQLWNECNPDIMCVCLHENLETLDFGRLREIKEEIEQHN